MRTMFSFQSFNELGEYLLKEQDELKTRVHILERHIETPHKQIAKEWLTIDELQDYLPDYPAKSTIYGLVCYKKIPFHKTGKKLRFLKSEIDEWLLLGKMGSKEE